MEISKVNLDNQVESMSITDQKIIIDLINALGLELRGWLEIATNLTTFEVGLSIALSHPEFATALYRKLNEINPYSQEVVDVFVSGVLNSVII